MSFKHVLITNHTEFYIKDIKEEIDKNTKNIENKELFYEIVVDCINVYINKNFRGKEDKIKEYLYFQNFDKIIDDINKRYKNTKYIYSIDIVYESFIQYFTKIY